MEKTKVTTHNPYYEKLHKAKSMVKRTTKVSNEQQINGSLVQVVVHRELIPVGFSRMYQYKDQLSDLSPEACKVVVFILLNMQWGEQQITIKRTDVLLSKRVFSRAVVELFMKDVIRKVENKRERYWVNLSMILIGSIELVEA